jgi:hypothetical protein
MGTHISLLEFTFIACISIIVYVAGKAFYQTFIKK